LELGPAVTADRRFEVGVKKDFCRIKIDRFAAAAFLESGSGHG
jgi:hypothetical protein